MKIEADARELLATAADRLGFSARAFYRVLRVARTIADLEEEEVTRAVHVAEALRFRPTSLREADAPAAQSA